MIKVIEAVTKKQMKEFALFPIRLYEGNPYYVPAFVSDDVNMKNPKKNFAAEGCDVKCFLAIRDGKTVGRVAAIIVHESNKRANEKCVRFSRIDFVEDIEVARALLKAVEDYGRENGMDTIHGPWGFDDTDREGMLTEGFEEKSVYVTNYSYEYYADFLTELGYKPECEWVEYRFNVPKLDPRYTKLAEMVQKRHNFVEAADKMSLKKFVRKYGKKFFDCYNAAYRHLDGFVDISEKVQKALIKLFSVIINEKFYSVILDKKTDNVVAFGIAIPSIGHVLQKHRGSLIRSLPELLKVIKNPEGLELLLVGVHPDYRMSGANAMVINRIWSNVVEAGITDIVGNPMLTTNLNVLNQWKNVPHETIKKRKTFRKSID